MSIKLLITGGTIDKIYNEHSGDLGFDQSHIMAMLKQGRTSVEVSSEVLFLKDSLTLNDKDRALILRSCVDSEQRNILISHGTDTMADTARFLANKIGDKTVVLFGAMRSYSMDNSDALFNLGVAICAVQHQDFGVYVAMNGQVFNGSKVSKDRSLGVFTDD